MQRDRDWPASMHVRGSGRLLSAGLAAGCGGLFAFILWMLSARRRVWLNVSTGPDSYIVVGSPLLYLLLGALFSAVFYIAPIALTALAKAASKRPRV